LSVPAAIALQHAAFFQSALSRYTVLRRAVLCLPVCPPRRYRCLGPGYLWIRYGQPYDGFTATNAGMKAPVYVQSTWLRSRMEPNYPMRYQFVMDLIEELTLCKYKGRPHW
jgi:hypothetical protein